MAQGAARRGLVRHIAALEALYGPPSPSPASTWFEIVLWETCAYLVDDERRAEVYGALQSDVGLTPEAILSTPPGRLAQVIERGGMQPDRRAEKLHEAAELAIEAGVPALTRMIRESPDKARRVLRKFPGVGEPGADHILLHGRALVTLAPDSNGLRVLIRLGYGSEKGAYAEQYRAAAKAVRPELKEDWRWLMRARSLLRTHGQQLCRRAAPECEACPLRNTCRWFLSRRRSG